MKPGVMDDYDDDYDEFGLLQENAADAGLCWSGRARVVRQFVDAGDGRRISAVRWGSAAPELVLLHGGGQNAHTWDTVALALGRPLLAIDLPGHGHSDWRSDHDYRPATVAPDLAVAIGTWAPAAAVVPARRSADWPLWLSPNSHRRRTSDWCVAWP